MQVEKKAANHFKPEGPRFLTVAYGGRFGRVFTRLAISPKL